MLVLLIDLGWKSALVAGVALLASHSMRRRAPAERVALLRAALGALLLLPLLALLVPELEVAVLPAVDVPPVELGAGAVASADSMGTAAAVSLDWLSALYLSGAALLLFRLAIGLATLSRWTRAAAPVGDPLWAAALRSAGQLRRPVRLLVSPHVAAPMSWGLAPAWILIGPQTVRRAQQAEAVIAHELAHVRRFDWPVLMAAQLVTLLFWFNPLVWLLARELARQTELAADEEAIAYVTRADYAQTLLALAGRETHPAACGMSITHSALGRRICCVLDADAARPASRLLCAAMLVCVPVAAAPLAAMQLVRVPAPAAVSAPAQVAVKPAPVAAAYLPAIIPAAQAAEMPVVQRPRSSPRRVTPVRLPRAADAGDAPLPTPLGQDMGGQVTPRHPGHTPPPPRPPAPGSEAAAWQEALSYRRVPIEARPRVARTRRLKAETGTLDREDRAVARELAAAAKGLRVRAQDLEAIAANGDVAREIRSAHARAAGSLRTQADRLDREARRKLGG